MSIRRTASPSSGGPSGSGGGFWTALAAWCGLAVSLANLALLFHIWNLLPADGPLNGPGEGEPAARESAADEGWREAERPAQPSGPEPVTATTDSLGATTPATPRATPEQQAEAARQPSPESARSGIRLQVQNGTGVRLMAAKAADGLRRLRYDVRETGNAQEQLDKTRIISRVQDPGPSLRLAQDLGLSSARIRYQEDPLLVDIDVTLILGADYQNLPVMGSR
jgi:hypothetical protein